MDHLRVPGFRAGFIGVDVFFVISGFLITSLLAGEQRHRLSQVSRRNGSKYLSITSFYKRRARRILPASLTVIAATLVASKLLFNEVRFTAVQADAFWATLFAANFHLMDQATDYFAVGTAASPLQNYWSLAVEEQFYFVWPALMIAVTWLGLSLGTRSSRSRNTRPTSPAPSSSADRWQKRSVVAIAAVTLASLAWSITATASNPASAYYSPFTRAYELGIGAFIALAWNSRNALGPRASAATGGLGAGLILASMLVIKPTSGFPGWLALLPTVGTALVIVSGMNGGANSPTSRLLSIRPMRFVGKISYSVYLWHWPIIIFAATLLPEADLGGPVRKALLFSISIGAGWLSYLLIEQPFRKLRRDDIPDLSRGSAGGSRGLTKLALMAIGSIIVIATIGVLARPLPRSVETLATADENYVQWASWKGTTAGALNPGDSSRFGLGTAWDKSLSAALAHRKATPEELSQIRDPEAQIVTGCFDILNSSDSAKCSVRGSGDALPGLRGPTRVLLIGDSFAGQWRERLAGQLPESATVVPVTLSFCFVAPGPGNSNLKTDRDGNSCSEHSSFVRDSVKRVRPAMIVISTNTKPTAKSMETLIKRLTKTAPTVWIGFPAHAPKLDTCFGKDLDLSKCNGPLWDDLSINSQYKAAAQRAGVKYLDLIPLLCRQAVCPAFIGGQLVRPDGIHLSKRLLDRFSPLLRQAIEATLSRR